MDAFQQCTDIGVRRILLHVLDMHRRALYCGTAEMGLAHPDPPLAQRLDPVGAHAKGGFGHEDLFGLVEFVNRALVGLRELRRAADDGGQHGVEVERGIHRAQYFLERLQFGDRAGQRVGAVAQIVEKTCIFYRNHGLVGESANELNLFFSEGFNPLTPEAHRPDNSPIAYEGNAK
jgi:hypothetical protein